MTTPKANWEPWKLLIEQDAPWYKTSFAGFPCWMASNQYGLVYFVNGERGVQWHRNAGGDHNHSRVGFVPDRNGLLKFSVDIGLDPLPEHDNYIVRYRLWLEAAQHFPGTYNMWVSNVWSLGNGHYLAEEPTGFLAGVRRIRLSALKERPWVTIS